MYLVVRSFEHLSGLYGAIRDSYVEEGFRRVMTELVPQLSAIEGFVSYYSAFDEERAAVTSVSIYETRESAQEANRMAEEWGSKNLGIMDTVNPTAWAGTIRIAAERPGQGESSS